MTQLGSQALPAAAITIRVVELSGYSSARKTAPDAVADVHHAVIA
jgi:hypothetical protein